MSKENSSYFDQRVYDLAVASPLIQSLSLGQGCPGFNVHLKLDNTQPAASFKIRGIGLNCTKAVAEGCTTLVISSGGNAGYAMAQAARKLGVKGIVVCPVTSNQLILSLIRGEGAEVIVQGSVWDEAHEHAVEIIKSLGSKARYVHPFDDPDVWEGHSSIIEEISWQLPQKQPKAIVVSCGGGGLLIGLLHGLRAKGWTSTEVIVVETEGANSFNLMTKGGGKRVKQDKLRSKAITLGALEVAPMLIDYYFGKEFKMTSVMVTDQEAIEAAVKFREDHRMLVELACSASLASVYNGKVIDVLKDKHITSGDLVVIVCGGAAVNTDVMNGW